MSFTITFPAKNVKGSILSPLPIPGEYLFIEPIYSKNFIKILEIRSTLPEALILDLDVFDIEDFKPILNKLRKHTSLFILPAIGISTKKRKEKEWCKVLIAAGLDDCFFGELDWSIIRKRIQFLSEYKELQRKEPKGAELKNYEISLFKRIFDIVMSSVALLALSPLFLLIGLLIKLESKGPIFYYSQRIGTEYQNFRFIKFRSMSMDADKDLGKLAHLNSYEEASDEMKINTFFKIVNDPRVTKIGRIIRKTSIDELPQLINVLKGEMSIIGNRPLPLYEAQQLTKDEWAQRFLAPAGITGLWQVDKRGKDNLSTEDRVGLDIEYAKGVSAFTDFKILLKTIPAMWQRD